MHNNTIFTHIKYQNIEIKNYLNDNYSYIFQYITHVYPHPDLSTTHQIQNDHKVKQCTVCVDSKWPPAYKEENDMATKISISKKNLLTNPLEIVKNMFT